jgi:glyoxylase-like metal-dependent hydrolase (beta-lactamase superfamily II)
MFSVITYFRARYEYKKFNLLKTNTRYHHIIAIKDHVVNIFLYQISDKYILFDAGLDIFNVKKQFDILGVNPDNVIAVFLTHTDIDHRASISLFQNAIVYISEEEEIMLNWKISRSFLVKNKLSRTYKTIKNNETLVINDTKIKAIVTPGHTIGSTCFLVNKKYLFTGDAVFIHKNNINPYNRLFNMNTNMSNESLSKLTKIKNIDILFTAHYGVSENVNELFSSWNNKNIKDA